ncbi:KIF1-binding [Brachionus plicatilis]|uniref:KIF-binding protein n=1 Tax=Brachionus plicatilis TaxID=10195 RepID=A0A3M7T699_BRAPC|nr:KIF1-binding [Brachionus plicatilis]
MKDLEKIKQKYHEYLNLYYVESLKDPEEEPFKTKYESRKILATLLEQLDDQIPFSIDDRSEFLVSKEQTHLLEKYEYYHSKIEQLSQTKNSKSCKSFLIEKLLEFNLAKNYIDTEEIEAGEKILSKLVKQLDDLNPNSPIEEYNPLFYNLKLSSFNELVFVWSSRNNHKKCLKLIQTIEEIYECYRVKSDKHFLNDDECRFGTIPFDPSEMICLNKNLTLKKRRDNFEALYTHSLFFFAQIYGKLEEKERSANFCQLTLQRQIDEHNEVIDSLKGNPDEYQEILRSKNLNEQPQERVLFNPLDWATHAAALSQYYVCECDFATARHCLCCAEAILDKLNSSEGAENKEKLKEQTASIRRCWAKYGIELLRTSRTELLKSAEQPDQTSLINERDRASKFHFNLPTQIYNLDKCERSAIASNIALDFGQAKEIFLKAQKILNEIKQVFVIDGYVTDHCEITRDLSELYSCLIFFEEDLERKCKMQKRRLDLLQPICDELSEQFYLRIKRQLLFDVGTIYSELLDLKIDIFREKKEKNELSGEKSAQSVNKINQLALKSIDYFEKFLGTMKVQPERKFLPEKFDDHNIRPALLAKFYLGRLYSKMIAVEPSKRLENLRQTLDNYSYICDYCDKEAKVGNQTAMEVMINEYQACKEMITFLPAQMEKLRFLIK